MSYMNNRLILRLSATTEQFASLVRLQAVFAQVCTGLAPLVAQTRCWNRVALHHLAYRKLRERYPELGSQMVCNAIYSVCRSARLVYQNPASPWCVEKMQGRALPVLGFADRAPVYFDRHTLSIKAGSLSMYTLDGRLRIFVDLNPADELRFRNEKLKEILLSRDQQGFFLLLNFSADSEDLPLDAVSQMPEYLIVLEPEVSVAAA